MRTFLAVAFLATVAVSGRAQAPASPVVPAPEITFERHYGHIEFVRVKFADGSELQADKLEMARSDAGDMVRFKEEPQPFERRRIERVQVEVRGESLRSKHSLLHARAEVILDAKWKPRNETPQVGAAEGGWA